MNRRCLIGLALLVLIGCRGDAQRAREAGRERFKEMQRRIDGQSRSLVEAAGGVVAGDDDDEPATAGDELAADGVRVLPDGTQVRPDGTQVRPDGTQVRPDGTQVQPDGSSGSVPDPSSGSVPDGTQLRPDGSGATSPEEADEDGEPAADGRTGTRGAALQRGRPQRPTPDRQSAAARAQRTPRPAATPLLTAGDEGFDPEFPEEDQPPPALDGRTALAAAEEEEQPYGSDAQPPELLGVVFTPTEAKDGDEVTVTVSAQDNLAGLRSAAGSLSSPSRKVFIPFSLVPDGVEGQLSGRLKVPPGAESGAWAIASLRLTDQAQNSAVLTPSDSPLVGGSRLFVSSAQEDAEPPRLDAIELSPSQVEDGGMVRVSVRASDDGEVQTVRGILSNPSGSVQLNFYPRLNPEGGAFEGTIALPKHSEFGEWAVTLLTLSDKANNRTTLTAESEQLRGAKVSVNSATSDTLPPELVSVQLNPPRVEQGGVVEVTVVVTDDISGVKTVTGWAMNQPARLPLRVQPSAVGNEYRGNFNIPSDAKVGAWRIDRLAITDNAGNRKLLTGSDAELANATFEVYLRPR